MDKINLLAETKYVLKKNKKTIKDIEWIGKKDGSFFIEELEKIKKYLDIEYNSDYGDNKISLDFVVVGKDWWMERREYDGIEWWEYKKKPIKNKKSKKNFKLYLGDK